MLGPRAKFCGRLQIGRARLPLMDFVTILSWSRQIFLRLYRDARMENFQRCHVAAFEAWDAGRRVALCDLNANPKTL